MRRALLFTLCILTLHVSIGQARFGLKGGVNFANIKNEAPDNSNARIGFNAGGLLQTNLSDKLLLRPELLYSVKGYRSPATQFNGKAVVSLNYLAAPVLLGYRATENLTVLAGPEFGFLAGAKSKLNGSTVDISNFFRKFDIGADVALAYNITKSLGIDLRYNYGFKGLVHVIYTDQRGNITGEGRTGANRVLQMGLYYLVSK